MLRHNSDAETTDNSQFALFSLIFPLLLIVIYAFDKK